MSHAKSSHNLLSLHKSLDRLELSVDVMISKAEKFFYNCEYKKCIKVIEEYDTFLTSTLNYNMCSIIEFCLTTPTTKKHFFFGSGA